MAGIERLKAIGIIREDRSIDYSLILRAVALASKDKYLKQAILRFTFGISYLRRILPETYGWVMEVVPSRSYKINVRSYPINIEDLVKTLSTLKDSHELHHLVYKLVLEGGLRLSHAIYITESFILMRLSR